MGLRGESRSLRLCWRLSESGADVDHSASHNASTAHDRDYDNGKHQYLDNGIDHSLKLIVELSFHFSNLDNVDICLDNAFDEPFDQRVEERINLGLDAVGGDTMSKSKRKYFGTAMDQVHLQPTNRSPAHRVLIWNPHRTTIHEVVLGEASSPEYDVTDYVISIQYNENIVFENNDAWTL